MKSSKLVLLALLPLALGMAKANADCVNYFSRIVNSTPDTYFAYKGYLIEPGKTFNITFNNGNATLFNGPEYITVLTGKCDGSVTTSQWTFSNNGGTMSLSGPGQVVGGGGTSGCNFNWGVEFKKNGQYVEGYIKHYDKYGNAL